MEPLRIVVNWRVLESARTELQSIKNQLNGKHLDLELSAQQIYFALEKFMIKFRDTATNIHEQQIDRYQSPKKVLEIQPKENEDPEVRRLSEHLNEIQKTNVKMDQKAKKSLIRFIEDLEES